MKTAYVLGDIHGNFPALKEVFDKGNVQKDDLIIFLGDVIDAYQEERKATWIKDCVSFLMDYPNLIFVRGNHDQGLISWLDNPNSPESHWWVKGMGGHVTLFSYDNQIPQDHEDFFRSSKPYHLHNNILFTHAGLTHPNAFVERETQYDLMWTRDITYWSKQSGVTNYTHLYCGHTTTELMNNQTKPLTRFNISFLDTGAGHRGKLTLAKIKLDTGHIIKYWQA